MKSLLFIGGTGFFGQSLFDYLNKINSKRSKLSKIIILSRKRKEIKSKIKISYITKNIAKIKTLPVTNYIIYAANSKNNKENLRGIHNFISLLNDRHKKTRILLTSSGAVYGKINIRKKSKETDKLTLSKVNNFKGYKKEYAKAKIIMEKEFYKLHKNGFNVVIARLFTFIGKRILTNKNFAITNLLNQARNKKIKYLQLNDSRHVYRGYMNSEDLAEWVLKILSISSNKFEVYNVGSDEAITIENLSKLIAKKFNKTVKKPQKNNKKYSKNIDYYVPSILKAQKKLNLKIKFKIKNSLHNLI